MTDEEHRARAALLGGEYLPSTHLYRIREGPSFVGCAYYKYLKAETLEFHARQSEIDVPLRGWPRPIPEDNKGL